MIYRNILACALCFCLLSFGAAAQVRWIANAPFTDAPATSLYDLSNDNKPLILAVGNIHSQASERLFDSYLLQSLVKKYGADAKNPISDIRVAFLNVHIFPGEPAIHTMNGVPVVNVDEGDEAMSLPGWTEIYSTSGTGLYLVTPDHLVYKLQTTSAEAVYASVKELSNKLRPIENPDVRLLDVRTDERAEVVHVDVQNFSKTTLANAQVSILRNGAIIASVDFSGTIAPLYGAVIDVPVKGAMPVGNVEVIVRVKDDINPTNNVWTGRLESGDFQPTFAGRASQ